MKRGEVWMADMPGEARRRPVLILSRNGMSPRRPEITVANLTCTVRGQPFEVPLSPEQDGVAESCVANLDSINTIPKRLLDRHVCTLSPAKMAAVRVAILFALDL